MPQTLSAADIATIVNTFLEKASRLSLKNYDNDVLLIKEWAASAREELRGVDIEHPDLDAKTLVLMKVLAAGKQEDERIFGLALMAHNAARTGGNLAAQSALFIHLSSPAGFALAHEPDSTWEKLPPDVRLAMADLAVEIFGRDVTKDGIRDAVLSLKTEKIAGVVAYVVSGRMEGDVLHWQNMESLPGHNRPSLAEYLRGAIGFSCTDTVLRAGQTIVDGKREISVDVRCGTPSSNDSIAPGNRPDRLVVTPNEQGGAKRVTMALAFSGTDTSGQYFGDYLEALDALTAADSNTPFAGAVLNFIYVHAGNFIASGQESGNGVKISKALDGAPLEERQDLATLALLSTPLQFKSKKFFTGFFRFNPLVLGTSTLRWFHFVEQLADSDLTPDQKRREALIWMIGRFASGLRAVDFATDKTSYVDGGIQQQVNSALEKASLLLRSLPGLGGDVLTKKDYADIVAPFAQKVSDLVSKLNENISGRNVESVLDVAHEVAFEFLRKNSFAAFKEKSENQLQKKSYKPILVSCKVDPRVFGRFHSIDQATTRRANEIASYFGINGALAQERLTQRRRSILRLLKEYKKINPNASERTLIANRQTVERVAATIANDEIWGEVVRGNPTPSVIDKDGFCELSPADQEERWASARNENGSRLRAFKPVDRFSDQQKKLFLSRQEGIASIVTAAQSASKKMNEGHVNWKNLTTTLTKIAGVAPDMLWQLLLPEASGQKSPVGPEALTKYNPGLLDLALVEQKSWLVDWQKKRIPQTMKRRVAMVLDGLESSTPRRRKP